MTSSSMTKFEDIDAVTRRFEISKLKAPKGSVDLRYGVYKHDGEPSQYVVFLNGRSEWIEKYAYLAADLAMPAGTGFLTWDHRGQGASGGSRAHIDDYETFVQDAEHVISSVVADKPYVLMAHSMGALISLYGTLKGALKPQALVLGSPLLGLPNRPVPRPLAKPLSKLLTQVGLGPCSTGAGGFEAAPFADNILTHRPDLYQRIVTGPYKLPGATFGWVSASFQAIDVCFNPDYLAKLSVPTLVLGAAEESVVDPDCASNWVRVASQHAKGEVQLNVVHGARHELFSELPRLYEDAIQSARSWIFSHMSAR
jgi:lysophospholipase